MIAPVGAYGRHERLQQSPPHVGSVPPVVALPQTWPAGVQSPTPDATAIPQRPSAAPAAFVQRPPQQSRSAAHVSPFCPQKEGEEQIPPLHSFEQQSPSPPHGFPSDLHDVLSGVHVDAHFPPQHSPSAEHAALSAVHCLPEHLPPTHERVQHWVFVVHAKSIPPHVPVGVVHCFVVGSQLVALPMPVPPASPPLPPASSPGCASPEDSLPHPVEMKWTGKASVRTAIAQVRLLLLFIGLNLPIEYMHNTCVVQRANTLHPQ